MKVCAVIPAYNEAVTIGEVIEGAKKHIDTIFVVNNGSSDNTAEIARECGAHVIDYFARRGYGAAQYVGQQFALKSGFDYILQLDADGQHDPIYIPVLLNMMRDGDYDIVLGSRFLGNNDRDLSYGREIGIKFFSRLVTFLGGSKITDVTSGFKVYKASSLKKLTKPCDTHPAVEQMLEIAKRGMSIKEVPVKMPPRNSGESQFNLIKFAFYPVRTIWLLMKCLFLK